jgi:acetyl-CoA synthetase
MSHDLKGQAPVGFVILLGDQQPSDELAQELRAFVATEIGALARPEAIYFTPELPKTRSGKIMRRLLRDIAEGKEIGDLTTLADSSVLEALTAEYNQRNA